MVIIRTLEPKDWQDVKTIYMEGIDTGQATFQTEVPSWEDWDKGHLAGLRYVAIQNEQIAGWVSLSPVSGRCVYAGVAEVSVYVAEKFRGQKIGHRLLAHLIPESEKMNIWTIQAGIFPENLASINLHLKAGFRVIGYKEKVGKQNDVWRNVNLLERRSKIAGAD